MRDLWSFDRALQVYSEKGEEWLRHEVAPHLFRWEVVCHCGCGEWEISEGLKRLWSNIRGRAGVSITVNSGRRCLKHQKEVNPKVADSMHLLGEALDLKWPHFVTMTSEDFLKMVEQQVGDGGLGKYVWGVHVDTGKGKSKRRRW